MAYFNLGMDSEGVEFAKQAIRSPHRSIPLLLDALIPIVFSMAFLAFLPLAVLKGKVPVLFDKTIKKARAQFRDKEWTDWAKIRIARFENES